jgi:hypothetical protein
LVLSALDGAESKRVHFAPPFTTDHVPPNVMRLANRSSMVLATTRINDDFSWILTEPVVPDGELRSARKEGGPPAVVEGSHPSSEAAHFGGWSNSL